jgi:hypothetical protein
MGSSSIQGYVAYRLQEPSRLRPDMLGMVENTCWTWRTQEPLAKLIKERMSTNRKGETA